MINPAEIIEITETGYLPQFVLGDYKYDNSDFLITPIRLEKMCVKKYDGKHRQSAIYPFKVRKL